MKATKETVARIAKDMQTYLAARFPALLTQAGARRESFHLYGPQAFCGNSQEGGESGANSSLPLGKGEDGYFYRPGQGGAVSSYALTSARHR